MITSKTPVGEMINFLYKNDGFYKEKPLFKEITTLVDSIIIKSKENGVNEALKSSTDDLFKLRLEIINDTNLSQDIIDDLNILIQERIEFQFSHNTNYKALEFAFVSALDVYGKISLNRKDFSSEDFFNSIKNIPQLNYTNFISLLKSLPGKESKLILSYLNSSISLDYALIVSELVFDDKLNLKKSEIDNLISILKNSIEDYAVFSYRFGFWSPSDEDESQWIRNIKIRIGLFESTQKSNTETFTSTDFHKMFVA